MQRYLSDRQILFSVLSRKYFKADEIGQLVERENFQAWFGMIPHHTVESRIQCMKPVNAPASAPQRLIEEGK